MMQAERLQRPVSFDSDFWLDEAIWGHRLYDEQTPWLCFLEFLNVLQSELGEGRAFEEASPNTLKYVAARRLHLRNILFNNPYVPIILKEHAHDDARWSTWIERMSASAGGLSPADFSYLRSRFSTFSDFAELLKFLQASAIEGDSNKRWSSKFVFPYGPDCLYEDLRVKDKKAGSGTSVTNDRRFFARTGELLYLMVCRSGKGKEVLEYLTALGVVGTSNDSHSGRWNRLVALLQNDEASIGKGGSSPFLPYSFLPDYGSLVEDWLNISECRMPGYDALPHLVCITGVHLVRYFLARAGEIVDQGSPKFVIEVVSPKKTIVRELSSDSYLLNNSLSEEAILKYLDNIKRSSEWASCSSDTDPVGAAKKYLKNMFGWPEDGDIENVSSPDVLIDELSDRAIGRHKQHLKKFHGTWTREIGLASSRGSRRTRYAPTDSLLKTLVVTTVPQRMEFQDFLSELERKYGFVIGDKQAISFVNEGTADQEAFSQNAVRLEERLSRLGLVKRLSDACAYVINPFAREAK